MARGRKTARALPPGPRGPRPRIAAPKLLEEDPPIARIQGDADVRKDQGGHDAGGRDVEDAPARKKTAQAAIENDLGAQLDLLEKRQPEGGEVVGIVEQRRNLGDLIAEA